MWAADAWVTEAWELAGDVVMEMLGSAWSGPRVPAMRDGRLVLVEAKHLRGERVLAPTLAGWAEFVALAEESQVPKQELRAGGSLWWERRL